MKKKSYIKKSKAGKARPKGKGKKSVTLWEHHVVKQTTAKRQRAKTL